MAKRSRKKNLKKPRNRQQKKQRRRKIYPGRLLILIGGCFAVLILTAILLRSVFKALFSGSQEAPAPTVQPEPTPIPDPIYPHDYDWKYLTRENGIFHYEDDKYITRTGIDVSYSQGTIDWDRVKADGIEFAIIRAGYRGFETGELHEDKYFQYNMENAARVGIEIGVYFFSQAISPEEAEEEAQFVLDLISPYPVTSIAFDLEEADEEGRIASNSQDINTLGAIAFCNKVKEAGYLPLVYGSASWMTHDIRMADLQDITEFWMAGYGWDEPEFPYVFRMWQYSCKGHVDGIDTVVDLNLLFIEKDQL